MPARAHRLLIPLAALLAILPLLLNGPSCGHDFDFHLLSWLEASTQFAHLHYPHWAYTPAYNAGEPRFLFYPPLSWSLGAVLGLILPWTLVPAAFTFVCLTLSGFTAHRLASRYTGQHAATLAAVLYLCNPYMLFTAYERTAYGELLAAAWLPLLLLAALAPEIRVVPLAIPVALLWLSNVPAGVMSCYGLAFLTLLRLAQPTFFVVPKTKLLLPFFVIPEGNLRLRPHPRQGKWPLARSAIAATALGLALAAFYLVPAIAGQKYIQSGMATIEGMRIADNTLFHHMAPVTDETLAHDIVLHTASTVSVLLLLGVVGATALNRRLSLIPVAALALMIAFLLTPLSLPIWTHLPELRFLQFPWRLTAILGATLALFAAQVFDRLKLTSAATAGASLALAAALILPAWHLFQQPCDEADTVPARVALYHSNLGSDPTDEYTPAEADNDALAHNDPPYWVVPYPMKAPQSSEVINQPPPHGGSAGPLPDHFAVTLLGDAYLILNRRSFRGWDIQVDGKHIREASPVRDDGLMHLRLPPGSYRIDLNFGQPGVPNDETLGIAFSLLGLGMLGALKKGNARRSQSSAKSAKFLFAFFASFPWRPLRIAFRRNTHDRHSARIHTTTPYAKAKIMPNQPGHLPAPDTLVDIPRLITAYYALRPDPGVPAQRVSFGTSGHRGNAFLTSFNDAHIAAITQAIVEYRRENRISGPLFLAKDTHALSEPAFATALEVLAANAQTVMIDATLGYTPTPALSHAILAYNKDRIADLADGIVITPSHNPPEDGGFKYNPPNGGPADTGATKWIENRANALIAEPAGIRRIPYRQALNAIGTRRHDFLTAYVDDLANVIDFDVLQNSKLKLAVDPLGGAGVFYWPRIIDQYNLSVELLNPCVDPTFRFMTCDWDGKVRMDCSSPYAMASMIAKKDAYDVAWACDTDHDRHGIVTRTAGLLNPNHYLAVAIQYLFTHRAGWSENVGIGKTLVSSSMIDRVAKGLGRPMLEVPVGFKWFVDGLIDGSLGFVGEESAGASFLRRNGSVWTTDKDGLILGLLAAEMTAVTGKDPGQLYADLTARYGSPVYQRIDAVATKDQKAKLGNLSPAQVTATELAGDKITAILTEAPGNHAAIGGLKVTTDEGWFAARPSGTEDVYKIYAESFKGEDHLKQIQTEAQALVNAAIA